MQRASRAIAAPSPPSVVQRQTHSPLQSELIAQSREESFLDRDVEIGFPVANRPEIGPTVESYFRAKQPAASSVNSLGGPRRLSKKRLRAVTGAYRRTKPRHATKRTATKAAVHCRTCMAPSPRAAVEFCSDGCRVLASKYFPPRWRRWEAERDLSS